MILPVQSLRSASGYGNLKRYPFKTSEKKRKQYAGRYMVPFAQYMQKSVNTYALITRNKQQIR